LGEAPPEAPISPDAQLLGIGNGRRVDGTGNRSFLL
jgi:hypothetical protein